ncbi:hypothetical protein WJX72_000321 [[Myrmecia] bisecta]|uniref:Uncharacterized protein n=1 Tax=[Myrmecia] bisecta TaxID=41462 RepID=A0AAW1PPB9_9CHLO
MIKTEGCSLAPAGVTYPGDDSADEEPSELDKARDQLNRLMGTSRLTGSALQQLSLDKWGRSYDMRLCKRGKKVYFQVMWKFLEQQSFPLTEDEYLQQLDAVAEYLTMWGVAGMVQAGISAASSRGPGFTGGGGACAISIPLDVDMTGARSGEWDGCI